MPLVLQSRSEFDVVLDDAVMQDSDHASTIRMGVGVTLVGATVGRPTRVTNAKRPWRWARAIGNTGYKIGNFACPTMQLKCASSGEDRETGRGIASVLKFTESITQEGSDDAA